MTPGTREPDEVALAAAEEAESVRAVAAPTRGQRWAALAKAALPRIGRGLATAAVTCLPVGAIAVLVTRGWDPVIRLDHDLIASATDITRARPAFRELLLWWQEAFVPLHSYLLALPAVIWAWRSGLRVRATWAFATMMIGWNLALQVKLIVQRARPVYDDPVSSAPGYSFPSGHAFNATMAMCGALVVAWPLLTRYPRWVRTLAVAVATAFSLLTALDRVFLGVHFPSDVTAGVLLAIGLTAASYAGFAYTPRDTKERP